MLFPCITFIRMAQRHFQFDVVWPGHDRINKKLNFGASFFNLQPHLLPAPKSTLFVARTLSSQSAVIAHVRDCPGLKGTMLNGTVCRLSLFSRGLYLFQCHLYFRGEGRAFPFPPFPTICCRCIKFLYLTNFMNL